jgi:hypothetical protein
MMSEVKRDEVSGPPMGNPPDDGDDVECALRFDVLGRAHLKAIARPDGRPVVSKVVDDDLRFGDPFGC